MTSRFARAARLFADRIEGRKMTHLAAARQMIALALKLAADPIEVLKQQIELSKDEEVRKALEEVLEKLQAMRGAGQAGKKAAGADPLEVLRQQISETEHPEVKKALEEVLKKLEALRSKAASILAAGDGTVFMRMEEMFPEGAPASESDQPPPEDKSIHAPIRDVLGDEAPSSAGESTAGSGFMDADTLIETLEGALRGGKLSDEQRKSAEQLLKTLRESSPEKKKQIAARLSARRAKF